MFDRKRIEKETKEEKQTTPEPEIDEREARLRRIAHERKWDIKQKPRFNKWFFIMIAGFVAYLIITYIVRR